MTRRHLLPLKLGLLILVLLYCLWVTWKQNSNAHESVPLSVVEEYSRLDLEHQLQVYIEYQPKYPTSSWMLGQIARRGESAYDAVLPYLKGKERGITPHDAVEAMMYIHQRGFDLKGSEAESIIDQLSSDDVPGANTARTLIMTKPPGYRSFALDLEDSRFLEELHQGPK